MASLTSIAYRAQHFGMLVPAAIAQQVVRFVGGARGPRPAPEQVRILNRRIRDLFERDLANVEAGMYPKKLLFSVPVTTYARQLPSLFADFPRSMMRRRKADWRDLPDEVDVDDYPPYFRRTFHWQTDGYLSQRSAKLYDVGVEFLFAGTADVMRRQVIPPLTQLFRAEGGAKGKRVLDVACGTGRTLSLIAETHPDAKLYGLDLSPYYVQEARRTLADVSDVSLVADNAEHMPFSSELFDAVTCVYLFHELPKNARRRVMAEMYRVLRPGGVLVIEDSGQYAESSEIQVFLDRFPEDFHEPFFRDYLKDDLAPALEESGFIVEKVDPSSRESRSPHDASTYLRTASAQLLCAKRIALIVAQSPASMTAACTAAAAAVAASSGASIDRNAASAAIAAECAAGSWTRSIAASTCAATRARSSLSSCPSSHDVVAWIAARTSEYSSGK
jgi:ubiquinone/menaquinone biosynthesis C-methylase UbiE